MSFSISVTERRAGSPTGIGTISIGDFQENFRMNFTFWTPADYKIHWGKSAQRALRADGALFIASITDPASSNFIMTWPCYRIGEQIVFQQCIIFLDELPEPFDILTAHRYLPRRETETEEGETVSEWTTSALCLQQFYQSR